MLWILLLVGCAGATSPPRPPPTGEPLHCGPNAHVEDCPPSCPSGNCSDLYSKRTCTDVVTKCRKQCRCDDGFFMNEKTGECITGKECSIYCPLNEVYRRNTTLTELACPGLFLRKVEGYSGCACEKGYVRLYADRTAPCVRPEECPSQPCPCNEHWDICPVHCPDDTCKTNVPGYECPDEPYGACRPKCVCDKGYLRDDSGRCVPCGQCPNFCPKHEHWKECPEWCPRDSCAEYNPRYKCPQPPAIPLPCYPDCVCDEGYARNDKGICIPEKKCPKNQTCGVNEVFKHCKILCPPQSCASIYTLYKCITPQPCEPGCDCLPGHLRNEYGLCIRSEQCPLEPPLPPEIPECGPNRVYKKCGPVFADNCYSINDPDFDHGDGCVEGCFCRDGYVEKNYGECVPIEECQPPTCFDKNEVYRRCGSGYDQTCEDHNSNTIRSQVVGPREPICIAGCYCKEGYARDENGICVKLEECPKEPKCLLENEVFLTCGSACPDTCDNYDDGPRVCTKQCVRGCFCAKGYVRRGDGACVKSDQCPKPCGYNEEYNYCASSCPVTCSNRFTADEFACIQICRERCDCIPGTLRNSSGVCVPVDECTPPVCKKNQEYQECGTACPDTCVNYKDTDRPCTKNCVQDCFCIKGYVRNDKWECVKPQECPATSNCSIKVHEVYSECSAHCELTCNDVGSDSKVCTRECRSGCVCEKGYYRRSDGLCVRPQQCPQKPVCSLPHEEYSQCNAHCQRTCDNYKQANLICTKICKPGCVCKKGYVRRQDGFCVKRKQCHLLANGGIDTSTLADDTAVLSSTNASCPKNEHWDTCPARCPRDSCSSLNKNYKCPERSKAPLLCKPDCVCNRGYLRNDAGVCVPIKHCPKNQTCGVNEAYTDCIKMCPSLTCDAYLHPPKCDRYECVKGCDCIDGYLRNKFGECIRKEQCVKECGINEQYNTCGSHCRVDCIGRFLPPPFCILSCRVGCECLPGYMRHDNGTCVLPNECSKPKCPKHSKYNKCGISCETTCGNLGKPHLPCVTACKEGCFCDKGYVKNDVGECVKPKDCPKCKVNERYVDCILDYCGPRYCGDLGFPTACVGRPIGGRCNGGCICIDGYVRDENGICIPKEHCPSCGGDYNATSGCNNYCGHTCTDYQSEGRSCPGFCEHNGCKCKEKYVYNKIIKKCVKPDDCPIYEAQQPLSSDEGASDENESGETGTKPKRSSRKKRSLHPPECEDKVDNEGEKVTKTHHKCGENEHFDKCPPNCPPQVCSSIWSKYDCSNASKKCHPQCRCDDGYLRNDKTGQCLTIDECLIKCGVNEHYVRNGKYPMLTCSNCGQSGISKKEITGCVCDSGYVRLYGDGSGPCVRPEECQHHKCGENEHFEKCPPNCPPQVCSSIWSKYDCSNASKKCHPQCRCDDGYLRNDKTGQCLTIDECLINCGVNEHYVRNGKYPMLTCSNRGQSGVSKKKITGCVCDSGYVRLYGDGSGPCVRPEECPSQRCPRNEHWNNCPLFCPDDTCTTNIPGYKCPKAPVPLICKPRCYCDPGYLRDDSGKCIPSYKCPRFCPNHEHWEECPGWCPRDSCVEYNPHYKCPQLPAIPLPCYPDCVCDEGYARNDKGVCVPEKKCPKNQKCGVNEIAKKCKILCPPQSCASIYTLYKCVVPQPCEPGCDCLPGYLRNEYGLCIRSEQCPREPPLPPIVPVCGPHRVYKKCGPLYPDTCDSINDPDYGQGNGCVKGCFCEDGYVENRDGECVPVDKCPRPTCVNPHEVYKRCGPGCDRNCRDYRSKKDLICAAGKHACVPGCYCEEGYYRNENGLCVLPKKCPPEPVCLGANEVYNSCGSSCPDTCENYKNKNRICTLQCVEGCFCKKGFVRRSDGACVKPEECPKPCGHNEEYSYCMSKCPVTCANRLTRNAFSCAQVCVEGCACVKGTLRNDAGVCVPVYKCSPPVCKKNEEYQECGTACPDTCRNYNDPDRVCTDNCVEDCFCKKGYVRNDNWECVKPKQCPAKCECSLKPHEVYSPCSAHCEDTCEDYGNDGKVCTYECRSGCVCEKGYVRRNDGLCVRPRDCPPKTLCTLPHEVYSQCGARCQRTCDNYKRTNLLCPAICQPGCVCKKGYVRRHDGLCVKPRHCPNKLCPRNEHWESCPSSCPRDSCASLNPDYKCPHSSEVALHCQPDCVCNRGYLRNINGTCVPIKHCPTDQTCGVNEVFKKCRRTCPPQTCDARLALIKCAKPVCEPGCDCIDGYLRNKFGQCIRAELCDQEEPICGVNEQYYECTSHCPTTCRNRFLPPKACILSCKIGCDCAPGYLRHDNGTCVLPNRCSEPECPAHASYNKCGTACPLTCRDIGNQHLSRACSDICVEGCFCNNGYVKNDAGRCVKPQECSVCRVNERYIDCLLGYCGPKSCKELGFPIACAGISVDGKCEGGCICVEGYVRNEKGLCIPKENCPSCGGDFNATSGCGSHCGNTCSDYEKEGVVCPLSCLYNGCDCKKGYVYDTTIKQCVKPKDCPNPKTCPKHEKYVNCVLGYCVPKTCDELGFPVACPDIIGPCEGGCVCEDGYVRDVNGICIPKEECPSCGGDYNAVSGCGNHCNNTCSDRKGIEKPCAVDCPYNGCDCRKGYVYDELTNKCVLPEQCTSCPKHEHWAECPAVCPRDSCAGCNPKYKCPTTPADLTCYPDCVCDKGYLRNNKGICVPRDKCPNDQTCGINEVWKKCRIICPPQTCESIYTDYNCKMPQPCEAGCDCLPGYLRNKFGQCIRSEQCSTVKPTPIIEPEPYPLPVPKPPIKCGPNSRYVECKSECSNEYCPVNDNRGPVKCVTPDPCKPGCVCDLNHKRSNTDGKCIVASDCPPVKCTRPNEVWDSCPSACLAEDCSDVDNQPTTCNTLVLNCEPRCICRKGYFRNKKGICVAPEDCDGSCS